MLNSSFQPQAKAEWLFPDVHFEGYMLRLATNSCYVNPCGLEKACFHQSPTVTLTDDWPGGQQQWRRDLKGLCSPRHKVPKV